MKTTIEIADDLLARARREARKERTTLRAIVDDALRQRFTRTPAATAFRLKRHPFKGHGLSTAVNEGEWQTLRDMIYRLG